MAANTKHRKNHKQKVVQFRAELKARRRRAIKDATKKMNDYIMAELEKAKNENTVE